MFYTLWNRIKDALKSREEVRMFYTLWNRIKDALLPSNIQVADKQVTACCSAPIEMVQAGKEIVVRCSSCSKYIGHVVTHEIGRLESKFLVYLAEACRERRIRLFLTEKEQNHIWELYVDNLQTCAKQAIRKVLRDSIPIEKP